MKRRYIDADIWEKQWFRKLSPTQKNFVIYLFTRCDHAGIWEYDLELAEFYIGEKIDDPESFLPESFEIIKLEGNKWFLPKFLSFQYEGGLNSNKPCIISVRKLLKKNNLNKIVNELYGNDYLMIDESLDNDNYIVKRKDKSKDKSKSQSKDQGEEESKRKEESKDIKIELKGNNGNGKDFNTPHSLTDKATVFALTNLLEYDITLKDDLNKHDLPSDRVILLEIIRGLFKDFGNAGIVKDALDAKARASPGITLNELMNLKYKGSGLTAELRDYLAKDVKKQKVVRVI